MFRIKWVILLAVLLSPWAISDGRVTADSGRIVTPQGTFTSLAEAVAAAEDGDTLEVYGGTYSGQVEIAKSLSLIGHDKPVIDGENKGTVLKLTAPGIVIKGFVIKNSGDVLDQENSGIAIEAPNIVVEDNRFEETLFGVYLRKASGSVIRNNSIYGKELDLPRRGDPIRVWYSNDVLIENNHVQKGRDVVLWYSERLRVRNNEISEGRYGLHFMYCDDAVIEGNQLIENSVGAFLMYSRRLHLHNNFIAQNRGPSGFGVGMKDMDDAVIRDNLFMDNRIGASVDNSPREVDSTVVFDGNVFSFNDTGVKLMPSVRRNQFSANSFKDNQEQVSVGGSGGSLENHWTVEGVGNYWSDYVGFDGDHDGQGDVPYKSEKLFEDLMERHPSLRLFIYSPSAQSVDFAAKALPMVRPKPKLTDAAPLMEIRMPEGLPAPPQPSSGLIGLASAGMLAVVAGLIALPRFSVGGGPTADSGRASPQQSLIEIKGLTKRFGQAVAINNLSFDIKSGESVALWGSNGAGKTTIIRCILGLLSYDGRIDVSGAKGKEARRQIGFVPQELNLHEDLSVQDTMRFYARLKKAQLNRIEGLLERMGLTEHSGKQVRQLSGGMKQRLALALALLSDPAILILDEPTASLDARSRTGFLKLVSELHEEGKTLIFASHRVGDILSLADRVLVLEGGRLITECGPEDMSQNVGEAAMLRIYVPSDRLDEASEMLAEKGFNVSRNGSAVLAQVSIGQKAGPISALAQAGIPVRDFEVEPWV